MFTGRTLLPILTVICATFAVNLAVASDWPRFRGPNGSGVADAKTIPVKWTEKDLLWKVELPGLGNSSPVVWKDLLFVESASKDGNERMLSCIDVKNGITQWVQKAKGNQFKKLHEKNTMASASPAVDAEHVYALFWDGSRQILNAYTHDGKPVWTRDLGTFASQHGAGTSPIPYNGKVYFNNDQDGKAELLCLDGKTGKTVWFDNRPAYRACYASPIIRTLADGKTELVVSTTMGITGYDPDKGTKLWNWEWKFKQKLQLRTVGSPVYNDGILVSTSGDSPAGPRHMVAIRLGDKSPQLIWENVKEAPYMSTVLMVGKHIYCVHDLGLASCYEADTGKQAWHERLEGEFISSPVLIDGKMYVANTYGDVYVIAANPAGMQILAINSLKETIRATPAVADERLFYRGQRSLFCIGKR